MIVPIILLIIPNYSGSLLLLVKYEDGVNLLYPKIGENGSKGSEFKELCSMLNWKTMGISIHVRGITKWGRRASDCVTAHGLCTYYARTVSSSPRRRSPSVPVRMILPCIRVVVGGSSEELASSRDLVG